MRPAASVSLSLALVVALAACAPVAPSPTGVGTPARAPAAKQRLVATVHSDPAGLHLQLTQPSNPVVPGLAELHQLVNAALTYSDDHDVLQPHLAEAVPTVENGLWSVLPDGRMETSWRLKPGIVWHDGTPFTVDDLLFSLRVYQDRELGIFRPASLDLVESAEATDPRTVVVKWKAPFIEADNMFSPTLVMPMARHLLEETYLQDKTSLLSLPYWREGFVAARVADIRKGCQHPVRALPLGIGVLGRVQPGEQRPDPWRILDFLLDSLDAPKHRVLAKDANHEPPPHGRVLAP